MTQAIHRLAAEALALQHAGQIDAAMPLFREVLKLDPSHAQANFSIGIATYQAGDLRTALTHLAIAAEKAPKHPQTQQLFGLALMNSGEYPGARAALRKAASLAPDNADIHAHMGDLHRLRHKPVLSRQSYEKALSLDPSNGYALVGMGQLEISIGNIDQATGWFTKAVQAGKELPTALHRLAFTKQHETRPTELDLIEKLLKSSQIDTNPTAKAELNWAAGKIYYDLGDTAHASDHFRTARRIHYAPFDIPAYKERLAFLRETFDQRFFEQRAGMGTNSAKPIFIFGMPRSGTTLAEQILARHSDVASGGEQRFFRHFQNDFGMLAKPSAALEARLRAMGKSEFRLLAQRYIEDLKAVSSRTRHVTDKMPHNFEMLWLMAILFPKASYIHCVRSPADTCVSLLSHAMSPAHNYCRTQTSVGTYYREYMTLMAHWKEVLPVEIRDLSYERLVHDQVDQSRSLVDHCGLDWQDACLEFYKGDAPVTTISDTQVRRPIFLSSVGRWIRHKDYLGDLLEALGPHAPSEMHLEPGIRSSSVEAGRAANDRHPRQAPLACNFS
ncbi:tetratricopeptide repeat-containing sulfotransferase family protein [Roseibium suaedae]|uniref:Tfp pilus assembly protein PilF n=1 Tax=Roseibium suaedae TaxID=735517 RepID=A0A1M7HLI6_9HYPH|nr:sulfotransferase [Roseibium suaedae]SHM29288.1 Tfp pilus assembly protein PilF [Roseibium suaedae]